VSRDGRKRDASEKRKDLTGKGATEKHDLHDAELTAEEGENFSRSQRRKGEEEEKSIGPNDTHQKEKKDPVCTKGIVEEGEEKDELLGGGAGKKKEKKNDHAISKGTAGGTKQHT